MSYDLAKTVVAWRRYSDSLKGIGSFFPSIEHCDPSIGGIGEAVQYSDRSAWPLLPIIADGVHNSVPADTINFLLTTHSIGNQIGELMMNRMRGKQKVLVTEQIRKEAERAIEVVDHYVTMYTKHLVDKQIYRTLGSVSSDKIQVGTMWVDKQCNQLPGTQVVERALMKSDLRHCPTNLAFCGVIQDDSIEIFRGRPHPVLIMPSGMWRNKGMPDEGCETYIMDITPAVTRAVRTSLQRNGVNNGSELIDIAETYGSKYKEIEDHMGGVSVMLAYAGQILEATARLVSFMLAYGFATKDEEWVNVLMNISEEIIEVIRHELTAEDNPNALFEIGGWS